ncbi:MAG: ABC transporter ATP-binding protein [Candidatus Dormibacteraeota bacterium]|nr:ABC transporter ATP-binding protein [Candidatus Dormibacteraeota bacterium]
MTTAAPARPSPRPGRFRLAGVEVNLRDRNTIIYLVLLVGALAFPTLAYFLTGGDSGATMGLAADAGVFVLLALGLNVVVGFAGLLDLGYAAFFAIGAYTYAMLASGALLHTPVGHAVHIPFWLLLVVGVTIAATAGALLGAPTLRLRGDYLAIMTLGFGEIVPRVFRNLGTWTGGINGLSALDNPVLPGWLTGPWAGEDFAFVRNLVFSVANPTAYYVLMLTLICITVVLLNNLRKSRLGRAWVAIREDETAAQAMGINTVTTKLLAFSMGAATSGFAGVFYGAKLSLVSPENFTFTVSITILVMIVLGGMGNMPGVIVGSLTIYLILFKILPDAPNQTHSLLTALNMTSLDAPHGDWPGLGEFISRLKVLLFGLILVLTMLLRPGGLFPSTAERDSERAKKEDPAAQAA